MGHGLYDAVIVPSELICKITIIVPFRQDLSTKTGQLTFFKRLHLFYNRIVFLMLLINKITSCRVTIWLRSFISVGWKQIAQLLAQTTDPVGLIIEQSGFASRSHFTTLFRDKFKMTPSEYRKVAKEKAFNQG